ncbi:hypothetical protein BKA70DRAFT_1294264 [Coprinopsis sp. MPI-PUGE-AT-0042]|nr:hypothetical protein BKA70DRAFT_1294264 [Coprinopsis sp. MPI-PUGE-AT-0042]
MLLKCLLLLFALRNPALLKNRDGKAIRQASNAHQDLQHKPASPSHPTLESIQDPIQKFWLLNLDPTVLTDKGNIGQRVSSPPSEQLKNPYRRTWGSKPVRRASH